MLYLVRIKNKSRNFCLHAYTNSLEEANRWKEEEEAKGNQVLPIVEVNK